ncbi:MAG: 2-oxoglutarate dehydrogenase E1 component, partial [Actinomycetota bacterium]|nr:2-oxoglutarate dehydrogenase E1 component [Actinomycetota bacterium]
ATLLGAVAAAMALVKAHRTHGHLAAHLDPLGSEPRGDPSLDPDRLEPTLTPELQARVPASVLRVHVDGETLADVLPRLRDTYCGTIAYEIEHIDDHEQRVWLRQAIESGRYRRPLSDDEKRRLLTRLTEVEGFELYLRRTFLGQKQFSIEGLDLLVPMLDEAIELAAADGAKQVVLGMAHRGRLNVLAHVVGRPYDAILREFEGERTIEAVTAYPEGGTGDVKYHLGMRSSRNTAHGEVGVTLMANPSHLEFVDPVAVGRTRAEQTDRTTREAQHDPKRALAILVHGDAAFPAEGVVAETLNLADLPGYTTGGTLHLIANNQVGFTTDPEEGRSTYYSSDLAKGFDIPIVHVNADAPGAALAAIRLALAFRARFHRDVVVDLVGYRRFGHNEQDEPAYTQPIMAERIAGHPPVRAQFAEALVRAELIDSSEVDQLAQEVQSRLRDAHEQLKKSFGQHIPAKSRDELIPHAEQETVETAVPADRLRELNRQLLAVPDGFTVNPKLAKQLERRVPALEEGAVDWGHAEALAFASLLVEGVPIRLTGQDTERGTFSHRHVVLHDARTGVTHTPLRHLPDARASFEVENSPLSEVAALGFEYGYTTSAGEALVLWEAQFGDFVNAAQVIVDQFIVAGLSKWRQTSNLTLLLPHGYEGSGPEHSSARLERFLQLAAQENLTVANCTTAAQFFHLLRRQALARTGRPLVVMTPKALLRLRQAAATLEELSEGRFRHLIDDPEADPDAVRRLVLCSGKLYYDIVGHEQRAGARHVAVGRLEQLYPFPVDATKELLASYGRLDELVWAQEEPQNMGAFRAIRHRLEEALPAGVALRYVGRPWRASPSEGYPTAHLREQDRIVRTALAA